MKKERENLPSLAAVCGPHANERKARGLTPTTSVKRASERQLLAKLFLLIWKVNLAVSKTKSH